MLRYKQTIYIKAIHKLIWPCYQQYLFMQNKNLCFSSKKFKKKETTILKTTAHFELSSMRQNFKMDYHLNYQTSYRMRRNPRSENNYQSLCQQTMRLNQLLTKVTTTLQLYCNVTSVRKKASSIAKIRALKIPE